MPLVPIALALSGTSPDVLKIESSLPVVKRFSYLVLACLLVQRPAPLNCSLDLSPKETVLTGACRIHVGETLFACPMYQIYGERYVDQT